MNITVALVWFAAVLLHLALAYACCRSGVYQRHPAFAAFVYFQNSICVLAACIFTAAPALYFWTYHFSFGMTAALTLMVALECGKQTFGPRIALPDWVPAKIATMVASAVALVIALDLAFAATNGGKVLRAMVTTEQGLTILSLAMFVIVMSYSRRLGISEHPQAQKIMTGFVLYLSVDVLAVFIRGSARPSAAILAITLSMGVYCFALVYWTATLWKKECIPERATSAQNQLLLFEHRKNMEEAAHVLGIEV